MYKKILGTGVLTLVLAFNSALADSWGCGEGLKKMVETLKLDESQKAKINPILEQLKSTMKSDGNQMDDLRKQLNQQVNSDTMDQGTVDGLVDKKVQLIGGMIKAKIKAKHDISMVLNPQQKTELRQKFQNLEEKISAKFKSCHEQD
jgi:periplasmic protein CpxP/Spy